LVHAVNVSIGVVLFEHFFWSRCGFTPVRAGFGFNRLQFLVYLGNS